MRIFFSSLLIGKMFCLTEHHHDANEVCHFSCRKWTFLWDSHTIWACVTCLLEVQELQSYQGCLSSRVWVPKPKLNTDESQKEPTKEVNELMWQVKQPMSNMVLMIQYPVINVSKTHQLKIITATVKRNVTKKFYMILLCQFSLDPILLLSLR